MISVLTLDQCLSANRPLTFVVAESDIEVLQHIQSLYGSNDILQVYSSTLARTVNLYELLSRAFCCDEAASKTFLQTLDEILNYKFKKANRQYIKIIFLDSSGLLEDPQHIRKIKDILYRYQLDEDFAVNLIFISHHTFVPPALERLGELVFFDLPDEQELKNQAGILVEKLKISDQFLPKIFSDKDLSKYPTPSLEEIVNNLRGLTLFEVEQAFLQSFHLFNTIELKFIRDFKKNAIAKTDLLSLMESDITFEHIGGMNNLKEWIKKSYGGWTVEGKKFGLPLLKGLLLVGLPGTGKSLIAKSIGNEWKLPVVSFDPGRIFSSRIGDSESNMRRVLKIVENMAPCVLFVDEIEKGLAGLQSSTFSDSGVTARVIGSFLIWMQECTKPVFIVATANNIQYLPPELISRFDETFFINLPNHSERMEIFNIHLRKFNREPQNFNIPELATHSEDLAGREIEQALRASMYNSFYYKKELSMDVIIDTLKVKTSLITTMAEQLNYLLKWVGWDGTKKDGIRARFANSSESLDIGRVQSEINRILKDIESK